MRTRKLISFLACVACLACAQNQTALAQGAITVLSTNDGSGNFSWTFTSTNPGVIIYGFSMKSYGVQQVFAPPGWTGSIDMPDYVAWTNGGAIDTAFTTGPLSFSLHSLSTLSTPYGAIGNTTYPVGLAFGNVFIRFAFDGPSQIVPEPSSPFLATSAFLTMFVCRRRLRAAKSSGRGPERIR